jgi:hypothetical protein
MSSAAQFYRAARPEPPRIIGLQLRPYSLGHHITLHAYDSSFLFHDTPRFYDLILGVFICSQTWGGWNDWRSSWKLPVFLKLWGWCFRKFDVRVEAAKFTKYIADGCECPEVAIPADARTLSGAWESRLKLFLVRRLRLSAEEAMDYPLALAWQEYCAFGESEGTITLLSESDKASLDFAGSNRMKDMIREAEEAARKEVEVMKSKAAAQREGAN